MSNKQEALEAIKTVSRQAALYLQGKAAEMTGTELYAEREHIPDFIAVAATSNMLNRPAGFTCKSSAGRIVRLIQPYDSSIYAGEPETLPAQWGFKWSANPADALPFISLSTSPYMVGDCCTEDGKTYRSRADYNVYAPSEYPTGWDAVDASSGEAADKPADDNIDAGKIVSGLLEED